MKQQTVLIVGASRGLGLGLVVEYLSRGHKVIATERKKDQSSPLRIFAAKTSDNLRIEQVDINQPKEVQALRTRLTNEKLDLLFVNAGICDDSNQTIAEISTEEFNKVLNTNALSPMRVIEGLQDLVIKNGSIAVMSSGLASVSGNQTGGYETYRASKAALNMLMRSYAVRAGGERSLFAMIPGWVKTDMGGPDAPLDVVTSCRGMVSAITEKTGKPGLSFLDYQNKKMDW